MHGGEKRILQIHDDLTVTDALSWDIGRKLYTIWFSEDSPVYVGGDGVYVRSDSNWQQLDLPSYSCCTIRGISSKDIILAGAFGMCAHYNGVDWKVYPELFLSYGVFGSAGMVNDLVVLAGDNFLVPIVAFGVRQ